MCNENSVQIALISREINPVILEAFRATFTNDLIVVSPMGEFGCKNNINILNDNYFMDRDLFLKSCRHHRPVWLYQQFLKYQIVLKSEYENTLIVDGDSLIRNKKFLAKDRLFYTNKNIERPYNLFIEKMLGVEYCVKENFITNQMNFNKETLRGMLNAKFGSEHKFYINISDELYKAPQFEFSEYQTYAAWSLKNSTVTPEKIKVFRRQDLIRSKVADGLEKYDLIAYENGHKSGFLRTLRAKLYYNFGINLG